MVVDWRGELLGLGLMQANVYIYQAIANNIPLSPTSFPLPVPWRIYGDVLLIFMHSKIIVMLGGRFKKEKLRA